MILKLDMRHHGEELYKVYIYIDFDLFNGKVNIGRLTSPSSSAVFPNIWFCSIFLPLAMKIQIGVNKCTVQRQSWNYKE